MEIDDISWESGFSICIDDHDNVAPVETSGEDIFSSQQKDTSGSIRSRYATDLLPSVFSPIRVVLIIKFTRLC